MVVSRLIVHVRFVVAAPFILVAVATPVVEQHILTHLCESAAQMQI